jgi:hypothetical protein
MGTNNDQIAPRLIKKLNLSQEDYGNRLIISCEVEASPKPDIIWLKDNKELAYSNRISSTINGNKSNSYSVCLDINDVTPSDSGLYKAIIKNYLGEVSASITLNFAGMSNELNYANINWSLPKLI